MSVVNLALPLWKEGDSLRDKLLNGGREMKAKSQEVVFDEPDGIGDFAQQRKAQPRVFFSCVIIT